MRMGRVKVSGGRRGFDEYERLFLGATVRATSMRPFWGGDGRSGARKAQRAPGALTRLWLGGFYGSR